ncbi:MAG: nitroreductase family protein [Anaerolineae bacterium]|jgi:nitroreductase|nr:nitroreductase family protein [Anaerolineae bacterium]
MTETHALNFEPLDPDESVHRSHQFLARMQTRRTVRDFSPRDVPFALIQNAIATAATAPSGANQQPWTFVVVRDSGIKRQIREAAEAEERENYERRMSAEWLAALAHLGTNWHKPHLEIAPYLIVVFAQSHGIGPNGEKVKHYYVSESVGIAVGLLIASLHQAGLATLTHTPSPMGFLAEILGRPAHERAYVVLPVGYPADDARVPVITKKPLDEVMIVI